MTKKNSRSKQKAPEIDYYDMMMSRFNSYIENNSPSKNRNIAIFWGFIAVLLMVASSFPLPENLNWLSALVGTPAGIIMFFLFAGIIRETRLRDLSIFNLRERLSHKKRVNFMFAVAAVFLIAMLFFVVYVPYGVGGAFVVTGVLFAYYFLRKTDDEKELDRLGLVDPRDYPEAYAEEDEIVEEPEDDDYEAYEDEGETSRR